MNVSYQNGLKVFVDRDKVVINNVEYQKPKGMTGNNQTIINGQIFIDGYEFDFKNKVFKKTFRSFFNKYFSWF